CLPVPGQPPQDSWSARPDSAPRTPPMRRRILNQCRDSFCFPFFNLSYILPSESFSRYSMPVFREIMQEHMFLFRIAQLTEKYKKRSSPNHILLKIKILEDCLF